MATEVERTEVLAPVSRLIPAVCLLGLGAARALGGSAPATQRIPLDGPPEDLVALEPPPALAPIALDLTEGERLVYELRWSEVPAGQAVFTVKWKRKLDQAEVYHVEYRARSNSFMSVFYPVDDRAISLVDAAGGHSHLFEMAKNEGRIHEREFATFDYEAGQAVYERRLPGPYNPRTRKAVSLEGPVSDPLSCFYYLRAVELEPGVRARIPVHTTRRLWTLAVDVLRREELDSRHFGKLSVLKIEPAMHFPGLFVRKGRMTIWVEEETRVPVLMRVDIPIGSVSATLVEAENCPLAPQKKP